MTVVNTDGSQEIPVVPVPDQEGKVLRSNADGSYAWGAAGAEPGSGKLYVKFGSAPAVDTNFNANSDSNVTLVIPLASAVEGNEEDGLMSSEDKGVLDGLPGKIGGLDDRIIAIEHDYVTSQGLQSALSPIETEVDSLGGRVGSMESGKATKVSQATSGNLASLDAGGDLVDSGISVSGVETAVQNTHSHANKAVLDGIPARSGTDSAMLYSADDNSGIAWKNWSYVTVSKKTANSVLIGKTWYPYVKIGSNYWITENLREPIGTKNTDYWIYDENTVVERGYIYKHETVIKGESGVESDALQALLHDGWHIPTESDAYDLLGTAGTHWENRGYEFMATDATRITPYTDDKGCTDVYGFHVYPSGCYRSTGGPFTPGYELYNDYATYYTKTPAGTSFAVKSFNIHFFDGTRSASIGNSIGGETYLHCCVRLCKSAT